MNKMQKRMSRTATAYTPLDPKPVAKAKKGIKTTDRRRTSITLPHTPQTIGVERDASTINDEFLNRALDKLGHDPKCSRRQISNTVTATYPFDVDNCERCKKIAPKSYKKGN
jgi:hypothetical protein